MPTKPMRWHEGGIRIIALRVGLKPHAAQAVFGLEAAHGVGLVAFHLARDRDIP